MSMQVLIELQDAQGGQQRFTLGPGQYYLGKADNCAIVLNDPHVSRHHATLEVSETDVILTDNNSTNGTWFENQRILNPILLQAGDNLRMGTMTLTILQIDSPESATPEPEQPAQAFAPEGLDPAAGAGLENPESMAASLHATEQNAEQSPAFETAQAEMDAEQQAASAFAPESAESATPYESEIDAGVALDPTLGQAPMASPEYYDTNPATASPKEASQAQSTLSPEAQHAADVAELNDLKAQYEQQQLAAAQAQQAALQNGPAGAAIAAADQSQGTAPAGGTGLSEGQTYEQEQARQRAETLINTVNPMFMEGMNDPDRAAFQQKVIAAAQSMVAQELQRIDGEIRRRPTGPQDNTVNLDLVSFGEIQPLMDDPSVNQIMINGLNGLFVERNGRLEKLQYQFQGQEALEKLIFKIIAPLGFDPGNLEPMLDTRLPDGAHINIVFPPIAADGPLITIRKTQSLEFRDEHFIHYGSATQEMMHFLKQCVAQKRNVIVTGAAGAGKSSCLNVISHFANPTERVVVIEDSPEINVRLPHALTLQTGLARLQGLQGLNTQLLLSNAFSMRPDRVILGEFYANNAFDMLMAMNSSSCGYLTTFQAHSPRDLVNRLELGVLMRKPDLPIPVVRDQLANAINIIVCMGRFPDGTRKITEICEIFGIEEGVVGLQPVFRFLQGGLNQQGMVWGRYEATGYIPTFYRKLESAGEAVDTSIFMVDHDRPTG